LDVLHEGRKDLKKYQCCGFVSGIWCLFDPWDQGSGMDNKSGSGSGMNNPDHISESLKPFLWVKILKIFGADPG
jgi:hypothetical protein